MSKESRDVKYSLIHTQLQKLSARAGLPWFKAVAVSKRRTQAATLVLRLMERCAGLKRPFTKPCWEGRAKKYISMLFSPVSPLGELVWEQAPAWIIGKERA
jgi:hypothetical protein